MYRKMTIQCPVPLTALDHLPSEQRRALLRYLTYDGIGRVSIVSRGGDATPLAILPDEAMFIEPLGGRWPKPAEERFGRDVRPDEWVIYEEPRHETFAGR